MFQRQAIEGPWEALPAERALALNLVSNTDLLRLKAIARLHGRGLPPDVGWADLLQEALTRVLDGSRRHPEGLPIVVFLAGVMRSIKAEHWRRARRHSGNPRSGQPEHETNSPDEPGPIDPAPDPERCLIAVQELAAIDRLFTDDPVALQIVAGLGEELSADEIRKHCGLSRTEYDSARKRMRRLLTREGLRTPQP